MRRALVTGGSGGIGSVICRRLARDGFHVFVHGNRNSQKAEAVVSDIRRNGGSADALTFDVADFSLCQKALSALVEAEPVQILVNNAGIHSDAPLAGMSIEQWRSVIDVSLNGFFNVTQPLLMPMIRTRWGRIVSVSSVVGAIGNRGQSNYAAAKAGLHGASKSLAAELATRGVTVNVIAPGIIAAGMGKIFSDDTVKTFVPMKRAGSADDVAASVAFLTSEEAGYITGQVICVGGGVG
jgi:3-oxoacyl-[acyl-carrier protein] reductase